MEKLAPVDYEVHDFIRQRWSSRGFSGQAVSDDALRSLFEAARYANAAAALAVRCFGAVAPLPGREEVRMFLRQRN